MLTNAGKFCRPEKFTRWDVIDYLATEEDMALYLDACLDEDPGDGSLVRAALNDIARDTGLTREGLYKALSATGNPEFSTMLKVIKALKIKLHAVPATPAKARKGTRKKAVGELAAVLFSESRRWRDGEGSNFADTNLTETASARNGSTGPY